MKSRAVSWASLIALGVSLSGCDYGDNNTEPEIPEPPVAVFEPQATFRFDTFGGDALWADTLRWHEFVMTVNPVTAFSPRSPRCCCVQSDQINNNLHK